MQLSIMTGSKRVFWWTVDSQYWLREQYNYWDKIPFSARSDIRWDTGNNRCIDLVSAFKTKECVCCTAPYGSPCNIWWFHPTSTLKFLNFIHLIFSVVTKPLNIVSASMAQMISNINWTNQVFQWLLIVSTEMSLRV